MWRAALWSSVEWSGVVWCSVVQVVCVAVLCCSPCAPVFLQTAALFGPADTQNCKQCTRTSPSARGQPSECILQCRVLVEFVPFEVLALDLSHGNDTIAGQHHEKGWWRCKCSERPHGGRHPSGERWWWGWRYPSICWPLGRVRVMGRLSWCSA